MSRLLTISATTLIMLMPQAIKIWSLRHFRGWEIEDGATVGYSYIEVKSVRLGPNASIGHFNVIRGLERLDIGTNSLLGQWNWISAALPFSSSSIGHDNKSTLVVGDHSAVTSRHYIDCSGGVEIGRFSVLAGVRSTILSHQVNVATSEQELKRVKVGDYCFVGSNVKFTPGASVPDRSLVAMGSVVVGQLEPAGTLFGGVPATRIKHVGEGRYFSREVGFIHVAEESIP